jgi:trehalose 6-phosphate synthase
MRLYVCSNSAPAQPRGPGQPLHAEVPGGLLPHLLALLQDRGGEWFFPQSLARATGWPKRSGNIGLHPVALSEDLQTAHYQAVSIETLLWLFHYLHETAVSPAFGACLHRAWGAYRHVNGIFAARMAAALGAAGDGEAVVLVNDYHFLLVPGALVRRGRPAGTRVVYAHQVPWCEPDYFGILPARVREEILASLLSCHAVVFHARRWREAFLRCWDRYLPGARVGDEVVDYHGRSVRVSAVPFPLDVAAVSGLQRVEATQHWQERFAALAAGRRLLVRVDRLDLWKNQPRGFAAFGELLDRRPQLAGEVCFLAVSAPVRYQSPRHRAYAAECEASAARVNETAAAGRSPLVHLLRPGNLAESRHMAVAALAQAAAVLVNPTYDGFNVVAKEALLLSADAPVLLSRNAGAHEYLAPAVIPVEPFDVTSTARALEGALAPAGPGRPAAAAAVRERLRDDSTAGWLAAVLDG